MNFLRLFISLNIIFFAYSIYAACDDAPANELLVRVDQKQKLHETSTFSASESTSSASPGESLPSFHFLYFLSSEKSK